MQLKKMIKTYPFKFLLLVLIVTGCAQHTVCEPNESFLICTNSSLTECDGFLKDKNIIIEEFDI
jgi:hypothetical protein